MTQKEYNGWTNYETWCCKLWMDNDEGSYTWWQERAAEIWKDAEAHDSFTKKDRATLDMAEALKSQFEEDAPELGASFWSDMLSAALQEVDWYSIAEHLIEDAAEAADESAIDEAYKPE